jgi:hypothetical protein
MEAAAGRSIGSSLRQHRAIGNSRQLPAPRTSILIGRRVARFSHTVPLEVSIDLSPRTVPDFVDIAFTRAFASSQAYDRKFKAQGGRDILPPPAGAGCNQLRWPVQQYEPMYA